MIDNNKVKASHTRRAAIVYIRQSHPSQVENNRESTARQYALAEKAIALGWDRSQVITIDEDLGGLWQGICQTFRIRSLECRGGSGASWDSSGT